MSHGWSFKPGLIELTVEKVDATVTGPVLIAEVDVGNQAFIPMFATIVLTDSSEVTTAGKLTIGTNATSYNNIRATFDLDLAGEVDEEPAFHTTGAYATVGPLDTQIYNPVGTDIYVNITVAYVATSAVLTVTLWGYYV